MEMSYIYDRSIDWEKEKWEVWKMKMILKRRRDVNKEPRRE